MGTSAKSSKPMRIRFSRPEVKKMEELLSKGKDQLMDEEFHQKLTEEFNRAPTRAGSRAIHQKMVQTWFLNRQKDDSTDIASPPMDTKEVIDVPDTRDTANAAENAKGSSEVLKGFSPDTTDKVPESSSDMPKVGEKISKTSELEFEARSSRDEAWYDVSIFLTHRVVSSGEIEVRVRFQGFGAEEDEWVDIKKAVRLRSIPLESSECLKIAVGDLVLCFREKSDQAAHFDAHVVDIERRVHDIRGCRCLFMVRFDHDGIEETVRLSRLCRRPSYQSSKGN